jgi:hypothetical protein
VKLRLVEGAGPAKIGMAILARFNEVVLARAIFIASCYQEHGFDIVLGIG